MNLKYLNAYRNAVHDTDRERALAVVHEALAAGVSPENVIFQIVTPTLEYFLDAVLKQEAVLSQHFIACKIADDAVDLLVPRFAQTPQKGGTIILGCASGDFHGLGKKIVGGCLRANMFDVIDLGVNVAAERFIETAVRQQADVIGVSSMMVHTALSEDGPAKVRQLLQEEGLEHRIKLIVGGAPYKYDSSLYRRVGADSWAADGLETVTIIKRLLHKEVVSR